MYSAILLCLSNSAVCLILVFNPELTLKRMPLNILVSGEAVRLEVFHRFAFRWIPLLNYKAEIFIVNHY